MNKNKQIEQIRFEEDGKNDPTIKQFTGFNCFIVVCFIFLLIIICVII